MKKWVKSPGAAKVVYRLCKGDHFSPKCPYKDTLGGLENTVNVTLLDSHFYLKYGSSKILIPLETSAPAATTVPPSMGGIASSLDAGESMRGAVNGVHLPALRVTNTSERI